MMIGISWRGGRAYFGLGNAEYTGEERHDGCESDVAQEMLQSLFYTE